MNAFEIKNSDRSGTERSGRKWKPRTLLVIVCSVAVVGFTSLLVHTFLQRREAQSNLEGPDGPVSASLTDTQCEEEYCSTKGCITAAARMSSIMNTEANPCEDFYEYVCGNYQRGRSSSIPEDSYNSEAEADEDLVLALKRTLDTPARDDDSDSLKTSRIVFSSCTNTDRRDKASLADFVQFLNDIHFKWPVLSTNWEDDGTDWKLIVRKLEKDYGIHTLFHRAQQISFLNPFGYDVLECNVPTLPIETYLYHNETDKPFKMAMYTELLDFTLKSLHIDSDKRKEFVTEVINLETEIARSLAESSEESSVQPSRDLVEIFEEDAERVDEVVAHVSSKCGGNVNKILEVLQDQPLKVVKDYLGWRTFYSVMRFLTSELKQLSEHMTSFPASPPVYTTQFRECAAGVRDEMGLLATKAYFDAGHFTQQQEDQIRGFLAEVKAHFVTLLQTLPWMDNVTLSAFQDKVKKTVLKFGYPEDLRNGHPLDHLFQDLHINENNTYFLNVMKVRKTLHDNGYRDHARDRRNPLLTNVNYIYVRNSIELDLGFIQWPMIIYGDDYPKYLMYGYMVHMAHDFSHSFDTIGSQFNAQGERKGLEWWSDAAKAKFLDFVSCLQRQEAERSKIDVTKTNVKRINEQIAELGAFFITYTGLSKHLRSHGEDEKPLPRLNLNKEQIYLVQAAQVHCDLRESRANIDPEVETGKDRLLAAIVNFEYFGDIFNCPVGSPMNPAEKCNPLR